MTPPSTIVLEKGRLQAYVRINDREFYVDLRTKDPALAKKRQQRYVRAHLKDLAPKTSSKRYVRNLCDGSNAGKIVAKALGRYTLEAVTTAHVDALLTNCRRKGMSEGQLIRVKAFCYQIFKGLPQNPVEYDRLNKKGGVPLLRHMPAEIKWPEDWDSNEGWGDLGPFVERRMRREYRVTVQALIETLKVSVPEQEVELPSKLQESVKTKPETLDAIADIFYRERERKGVKDAIHEQRRYERHLKPSLGSKKPGEVTPELIAETLAAKSEVLGRKSLVHLREDVQKLLKFSVSLGL